MNKDPLVINSRTLVTKQNSENKGEKELSGILRSFSCSNQQKSVKNCVMRSYSHDPNNARRVHAKKITRTYSNNTKDITRTYSHDIETKTFSQDAKKERRPRSGKLLMQSWKRWVCLLISKQFLWELDRQSIRNHCLAKVENETSFTLSSFGNQIKWKTKQSKQIKETLHLKCQICDRNLIVFVSFHQVNSKPPFLLFRCERNPVASISISDTMAEHFQLLPEFNKNDLERESLYVQTPNPSPHPSIFSQTSQTNRSSPEESYQSNGGVMTVYRIKVGGAFNTFVRLDLYKSFLPGCDLAPDAPPAPPARCAMLNLSTIVSSAIASYVYWAYFIITSKILSNSNWS